MSLLLRVRRLHQGDLEAGWGRVLRADALAKIRGPGSLLARLKVVRRPRAMAHGRRASGLPPSAIEADVALPQLLWARSEGQKGGAFKAWATTGDTWRADPRKRGGIPLAPT